MEVTYFVGYLRSLEPNYEVIVEISFDLSNCSLIFDTNIMYCFLQLDGYSIPCLWCYLPRKNTKCYEIVMETLHVLCGDEIKLFCTDFEDTVS